MHMLSRSFRSKLVLLILGKYSYGDYVTDPDAFALRVKKVLS